MGASKAVLLNLLTTLKEHKVKVPARGTWNKIHQEYNIGTVDVAKSKAFFYITDADKAKIKALLKANGIDPVKDTVESLKNQSRTEASEKRVDEKFISKKVKTDYVNVRFFGDNSTLPKCFIGMPYTELVKMNLDTVLLIENFETFVQAEPGNLPLLGNPKNIAFIYRGDKEASPKGVTQFLQNWTKSKIFYWGDFDAIGLSIAVSKEKYDAIILPIIDAGSLSNHSKIEVYNEHSSYMPRLAENTLLKPFIDKMEKERLAITQERMMAKELPLMLLALN